MNEDEAKSTWDFNCSKCEFKSTGWATKALADARGEQHLEEHESGTLMQDKLAFVAERSN